VGVLYVSGGRSIAGLGGAARGAGAAACVTGCALAEVRNLGSV
jgi:hypothetical protein